MKMVICGILPSKDSTVCAQVQHVLNVRNNDAKKHQENDIVKISLKFDEESTNNAKKKRTKK